MNFNEEEDYAHYIKIGEHKFELPDVPARKDIFFSDLPKKDQYWKRSHTKYPKIFYDWYHPHEDKKYKRIEVVENAERTVYDGNTLVSLSVADTQLLQSLIEQEQRRMRDGVWFMNNGEPTYLTGTHYGVLQWMQFKGSFDDVNHSQYGMYMRLQRDYCYFREICKKSKQARGGYVIKAKKQGITQLEACCIGIEAMQVHNGLFRIMSIREDLAVSSCMSYLKYAIQKMPPILLPYIGKENMSEVTFGKPDGTKGNRNKRVNTDNSYLETKICTVATDERSFDSLTNLWAWVDEHSKVNNIDLKQLHNVSLETVGIGPRRIGTLWYTGYVAEEHSDSFDKAREIYYGSKLRTIKDGATQTASKLLSFALLVWDGIADYVDKYGEPDIKGIEGWMNREIASFKGDAKRIQSFKHQYPKTEEECWELGAGAESIFDNVRLGLKAAELEQNDYLGIYPYFEFNFKFSETPTMDMVRKYYNFPGEVLMQRISDEDKLKGIRGVFRWYREEWLPTGFIEEWSNNTIKYKNGKLGPRLDNPFYASMDPTGYADKKQVVTGSKNAIQVFILPNPEIDGQIGKRVTNKRLMVSYLHRANSPEDTLKHCIQVILYFGCPFLVECNQPWVMTRLIEMGFENFLMVLNEDNVIVPYKHGDKTQRFYTSQKGTIDPYVNVGRIHYGDNENMDIENNADYLDDEFVIKDLIQFDPTDTKRFDAGVCHLIGLSGISYYLGYREKMKKTADPSYRRALANILRTRGDY